MRTLACLVGLSLAVTTVVACASHDDEEDGATSEGALTTLTVAQCKTPAVHTSPKTDSSGQPIAGSAHTTLAGCVVGSTGETGDSVRNRLAALLGDTAKLANVKNAQGGPVFSKFTPAQKHGTLATSITQDIDVILALDHAPYTKLHTAQKQTSAGVYSLAISNITPVSAAVAFFTVTVVDPGGLTLSLEAKAQANGITITGASDIVLLQSQEQAASASVLVSDSFRWLTTELAKSAPPAQQPVHDAGAAQDGGDASARDADAGRPGDAASSD